VIARTRNPSLRLALVVVLLFVSLFFLPQSARAEWVLRSDTVPAGQVVDNDVVITGSNVSVAGTVNGDVVAVGSNVVVDGSIQGSLVAVGRVVTINGDVGGSVYVVARTLKLGSTARVVHNVHFGGILLDSQAGSVIGRDLVAAGLRATVGSEIGRGLNAIILLFTFSGKIGYDLDLGPTAPTTGDQQAPPEPDTGQYDGTLFFASAGGYSLGGLAAPVGITRLSDLLQNEEEQRSSILPEWFVVRLGEFAALLLVGGLGAKPLPAAGYGLLALIIAVNAVGVALLLSAMLIAVGLWLGSVTLWTLALLFWGLGFSLLTLAMSLLALSVFFVSKIIVSYLIVSLFLERFVPRLAHYRALVLFLGVVLYILLRSIPHVGWVVEVILVVFGLGAMWLALRDRGNAAEQPAVAEVE
jgi:cytoskeletal protein CcmA (bactofilin family)